MVVDASNAMYWLQFEEVRILAITGNCIRVLLAVLWPSSDKFNA